MDVAALYVDARGVYPQLTDHWYDEKRDARTYAGPWPVVAHPPCGPWSVMRHLHSRPADAELGPLAVEQVRKWGGILEQPAGSRLWKACGLPPVDWFPFTDGTFSVEVEQCAWGHVARKRTWLYCVGVDFLALATSLRFGGTPTHWCSGSRNAPRGPVPPGIKVCSAEQRRRTPIAFAKWLLRIAATAQGFRGEERNRDGLGQGTCSPRHSFQDG